MTPGLCAGAPCAPGSFAAEIVRHETGHRFFVHTKTLPAMNAHDRQHLEARSPSDVQAPSGHDGAQPLTAVGWGAGGAVGTVRGRPFNDLRAAGEDGSEAYGHQEDATLLGAGGADRLSVGQDTDRLNAGGGDDLVCGNLAQDTLSGGGSSAPA